MPPYRAQMGGIFGSGLYPKQPPQGNAGDIIDAVTRGASTLIEGAYARKLKEREQAREDAQLAIQQQAGARADRAETRADAHDAWERETHQEAQDRADAVTGYTPKRTTTKQVVEPGAVESHGLLGAPGSVRAPSIKKEKATIPAAYNFRASQPAQLKQLEIDNDERKRGEHMADSKTLIDYREKRRSERPSRAAADTRTSRAATAVRTQIAEANTRIKALQAQRFAPDQIEGDAEREAARDEELEPMIQRRDSLVVKHDELAGKLTAEAEGAPEGSTRAVTIRSAYTGTARKGNGSTIRGGGEAAGSTQLPTAAKKSDGSTLRHPAKEVITQAEADSLAARGFSKAQITKKYLIQ